MDSLQDTFGIDYRGSDLDRIPPLKDVRQLQGKEKIFTIRSPEILPPVHHEDTVGDTTEVSTRFRSRFRVFVPGSCRNKVRTLIRRLGCPRRCLYTLTDIKWSART
jgi:hypothetical protein